MSLPKEARGPEIFGGGPGSFDGVAKCRHAYFKTWAKLQITSFIGSTCALGLANRFTDNGTTVTDNLSALVWEKKTTDGSVHDEHNVYTWSTGAPYAENGTAFTNFLETLNSGGGFAGANGWRLPTIAELQTIVLDYPCRGAGNGPTCSCPSDPCMDPALGPTMDGFDWSATSAIDNTDPSAVCTTATTCAKAWGVDVYSGNVDDTFKTFSDPYNPNIRAVRGGL